MGANWAKLWAGPIGKRQPLESKIINSITLKAHLKSSFNCLLRESADGIKVKSRIRGFKSFYQLRQGSCSREITGMAKLFRNRAPFRSITTGRKAGVSQSTKDSYLPRSSKLRCRHSKSGEHWMGYLLSEMLFLEITEIPPPWPA